MASYIVKRLFSLFPVLFVVSIVVTKISKGRIKSDDVNKFVKWNDGEMAIWPSKGFNTVDVNEVEIKTDNRTVEVKGDILQAAGIEVEVGVKEQEAVEMNEVFNTFITKQRPFVTMKAGSTLSHEKSRTSQLLKGNE